jgi:hypothetical protein
MSINIEHLREIGTLDTPNGGHIVGGLQNVILGFTPELQTDLQRWLLNDIAKGDYTKLSGTLSKYFCPLIWYSLVLSGYDIPEKFYKKPDECDQLSFDEISRKFVVTDGWAEFTIRAFEDNENVEDRNKLLKSNNDFENHHVILYIGKYSGRTKYLKL